jgi:predicted ATP-grasp superfamily ATP-dependent carboligase
VSTYRSAGDRISLAAARALGKEGIEVCVGSDDLSAPSLRSRHTQTRIHLPSPIWAPKDYVEALRDAISAYQIDTVLPADDYAVHCLSEAFADGRLTLPMPIPPSAAYGVAQDKHSTGALAARIGLRIPETSRADTPSQALSVAARIGYPVILKIGRGNGAVGVSIARGPRDIEAYYSQKPEHADPVFDFTKVLVQEFVPGETHDLCAVFRNGEPVTAMTSRRVLTYPADGGAGILVETTSCPAIRDRGLSILRQLGWHGPAQVEFKIDSRDGKPTLIEVNGRLWGTLALAIKAGINFPMIACRIALGQTVVPSSAYRVGLQMAWPVPYAYLLLRDKIRRGLWQEILTPRRNRRFDIDLADPLPTVLSLVKAMGNYKRGQSFLAPVQNKSVPL